MRLRALLAVWQLPPWGPLADAVLPELGYPHTRVALLRMTQLLWLYAGEFNKLHRAGDNRAILELMAALAAVGQGDPAGQRADTLSLDDAWAIRFPMLTRDEMRVLVDRDYRTDGSSDPFPNGSSSEWDSIASRSSLTGSSLADWDSIPRRSDKSEARARAPPPTAAKRSVRRMTRASRTGLLKRGPNGTRTWQMLSLTWIATNP